MSGISRFLRNSSRNNGEKTERVGRMLLMHANSREDVKEANTGDIVALAGLKHTITGHTLSDEKDYKGGELEFDFRNLDPDKKPNIRKCTEILPKGSLVVFPGFVWHRVCPVKKGSRHSLVIWSLGWPYQ